MTTVTVSVDVDVDLDDIDTDVLAAELDARDVRFAEQSIDALVERACTLGWSAAVEELREQLTRDGRLGPGVLP